MFHATKLRKMSANPKPVSNYRISSLTTSIPLFSTGKLSRGHASHKAAGQINDPKLIFSHLKLCAVSRVYTSKADAPT